MTQSLLLLLIFLNTVGWVPTDIPFMLSGFGNDQSATFTLGFAVLHLLFHSALLILLFSDRHFRAYSFLGIVVCLLYIFSAINRPIFFPYSPYVAHFLISIPLSLVPIALMYFVSTLYDIPQRFKKLVTVGWLIGLICILNLVANLFVSHAYLMRAFTGFVAVVLLGLLGFVGVGYARGVRPSIGYLIPLLIYLLLCALFYTYNAFAAGFPGIVLQESSVRGIFMVVCLIVPFLTAILLRQTYRDQVLQQQTGSPKKGGPEQTIDIDQLKTRFFTNISHEFRTPLTLLLGPLDDLRQRFPTDAVYTSMYRNAQRLLTLVNQLLDLAKLDAGQLKLNRQLGDLAAAFRIWVASFEPLAQSRGISLVLDQSETAWPALYDSDKLEQVTNNLLINALKFTNRGGQVSVEVVYEPTNFTLRISDTGVGIPLENLSTVFDRFYQAEPDKKNNPVDALYEGSGVSLALVRELVNLLEGTIGVASLVGEGTTFTLWIPLEPQNHPLRQEDPKHSDETGGPQQSAGWDITTH